MISAISDLQVNALILPTKFQVNWPFGSRKEVQNRFSRCRPWRPSWILDLKDFISFLSTEQVVTIFPSKFGISWPFGSREEVQNSFSRWRPSWISDLNDLRIYFIYKSPRPLHPTKFQVSWPFGSGEEAKYKFSRWRISWFPIRMIFIFDLQITPMLPTKLSGL